MGRLTLQSFTLPRKVVTEFLGAYYFILRKEIEPELIRELVYFIRSDNKDVSRVVGYSSEFQRGSNYQKNRLTKMLIEKYDGKNN